MLEPLWDRYNARTGTQRYDRIESLSYKRIATLQSDRYATNGSLHPNPNRYSLIRHALEALHLALR